MGVECACFVRAASKMDDSQSTLAPSSGVSVPGWRGTVFSSVRLTPKVNFAFFAVGRCFCCISFFFFFRLALPCLPPLLLFLFDFIAVAAVAVAFVFTI